MKNFKIRNGNESDKNFIFSTWLHGLYFGNTFFKEIPASIFFKEYQKAIEKIIGLPDTQIKVACLPDDEEVALGYAITGTNKIHWIFVKDSWRKLGIAKSLFPEGITTCTHLSKVGRSLRVKLNLTFNPFF